MEQLPVYLRALDISDLERSYKWHSDPDLYKSLLSPFRFASRSAEEEWLRKKSAFSNEEVNLAICLTETDEHIGNAYLREIDWIARSALFAGILIGDPLHREKGYDEIVQILVLRHAFKDFGLNRVVWYTLVQHQQHVQLQLKLGYIQEGVLRQFVFKDGKFMNVILTSFLAEDYFANEAKLYKMLKKRSTRH